MKDIALKAGVSTATMSRTLMNPGKVSQTTLNQVEQAALEVGCLPQSPGRSVRRNEPRMTLVTMPDICDPFFSEVIRRIEVTAVKHGYLVPIDDCAHQNQKERTFIDLIITKQIDGMVLFSLCLPFDASVEEQRSLPPMVMSNEFAPELELPTVHTDNLTAAFNMANYLHELGHQRIGCIVGPEGMPLCHYRLQGYVQALRRSGITADPHYITRGDFTFEADTNVLEQPLPQPMPPTTVFCHSDVMALDALPLMERHGLKVPDDLLIVDFDNITLSEFYDPSLAIVSQPRSDIGREGIPLLFKQAQGHNANNGSRLLDCELIVRDSMQKIRRQPSGFRACSSG